MRSAAIAWIVLPSPMSSASSSASLRQQRPHAVELVGEQRARPLDRPVRRQQQLGRTAEAGKPAVSRAASRRRVLRRRSAHPRPWRPRARRVERTAERPASRQLDAVRVDQPGRAERQRAAWLRASHAGGPRKAPIAAACGLGTRGSGTSSRLADRLEPRRRAARPGQLDRGRSRTSLRTTREQASRPVSLSLAAAPTAWSSGSPRLEKTSFSPIAARSNGSSSRPRVAQVVEELALEARQPRWAGNQKSCSGSGSLDRFEHLGGRVRHWPAADGRSAPTGMSSCRSWQNSSLPTSSARPAAGAARGWRSRAATRSGAARRGGAGRPAARGRCPASPARL